MIDLCPVGALTSKPFRYTARTWELSRRKSVSAHDSLGSGLVVQTKQERVMRVLPLEAEDVNECWISDRDRFAYEGLNSEERLTRPMVKRAGEWAEVEWPEALEAAAHGLKDIVARHGAEALGMLLAPSLTLEELHLAAKLGRGPRHRQHRPPRAPVGFPRHSKGAPWLGMPIADLAKLESVLFVGSTLRKEQPVLSARVRRAAKTGLAVHVLHVADDDLLMPVASRTIGASPRPSLRRLPQFDRARLQGKRSAILLGHYAQQHPDYAAILAAAQELGRATGAVVGVLPEGANSVGAHLLGALPGKGLRCSRDGGQRRAAATSSPASKPISTWGPPAMAAHRRKPNSPWCSRPTATRPRSTAHVVLPIAPFTETGGTFVNMEGRVQSFNGVVKPQGDARPGVEGAAHARRAAGDPRLHRRERSRTCARTIAPDLQAWATAGPRATPSAAVSASPRPRPPATRAHRRVRHLRAATRSCAARRRCRRTADGKAAASCAHECRDRCRGRSSPPAIACA